MRKWMVALTAAFVGCSSGRTEAGAIGQALDLRQYLPDTLRATTAPAADSTFKQEIPVGPDSARVEMVWTTYQHGSGRFLSTISARLIAPVQYDSLRLGNLSNLKNSGTKFRPVESTSAQVLWFKRTMFGRKSGVMNFGFDAAGVRMIGPATAH